MEDQRADQATSADASQLLATAYLQIGHLEQALISSRRIGAAVGVLMAGQGVTYEDAFAQMTQASQQRNVKVRDIAETVLYTGDLAG